MSENDKKSEFTIVDRRGRKGQPGDKVKLGKSEPKMELTAREANASENTQAPLGDAPTEPEDLFKKIPGLENTTAVVCACGSDVYTTIFRLRRTSAILSPTGEEQIMQLPFHVCTSCLAPAPVGNQKNG